MPNNTPKQQSLGEHLAMIEWALIKILGFLFFVVTLFELAREKLMPMLAWWLS